MDKPVLVHALWHGRALCGRQGIPANWSVFERWWAASDWKALSVTLASPANGVYRACEDCDAAMADWTPRGVRR